MKRRAALSLSFEGLRSLLHLRGDLVIIGFRVNKLEECVDIILEGDSLPETPRRAPIIRKPFVELTDIEW
jgi:hypothetical protein